MSNRLYSREKERFSYKKSEGFTLAFWELARQTYFSFVKPLLYRFSSDSRLEKKSLHSENITPRNSEKIFYLPPRRS